MIRSSACQPWQPDLPGHAGDRGDLLSYTTPWDTIAWPSAPRPGRLCMQFSTLLRDCLLLNSGNLRCCLLTLSSECLDFLTATSASLGEESAHLLSVAAGSVRREAAREPSSLGSLVAELPLDRQRRSCRVCE